MKKEEQQLQMMINKYCLYNKINFYSINNNSVPPVINGLYNRDFAIKQAMRQKSMGLKKGVADGFVIINNKVIFIEFKVGNGKQSPEQQQFELICKDNNIEYYIIKTLQDFIEKIQGVKND